ncbi:beta-galactosidase trimerization domain-containing protein [Pararhodonellum marinum]|uniref:beta-galactosidase trimerization domain-containing protein n=1 Tax=Pararhodonellum marinum TaxID=2755358 RepID=UPI00188F58A0|nr:beta-galactosidase trimerization domain-containing protein [Pararhodonellum marinum]
MLYHHFKHFFSLSALLIILGLSDAFAQKVESADDDPFLTKLYDQLHDSPMQQKIRKIAPMPAGVVYIQRPGEGEEEIRWHFRTMRELGFTNLKQIMPLPDWSHEKIQMIALEEGLIPWWYGEGGWEPISDQLLSNLGISPDEPLEDIRLNPKMIAYQNEVLKKRIENIVGWIEKTGANEAPKGSSSAYDPTVGQRGMDLTEKGKTLFVEWAKNNYGDIATLNNAYNQHHHGLAAQGKPFSSWEDFAERWEKSDHRELRVIRDVLRFKADHGIAELEKKVVDFHEFDSNAPYRAGGELGLFRPHAYFGVNFPAIAKTMQHAGSFYPSIHFTWHFDQVKDELGPTVYMQASYINDMFKGGWSGGWETTGGPQQFGGERYGQDNKGFTVDAAEMKQFTLSMLAAGFKGWGLWSWSVRSAGVEVGEYSLLDHHNEVTDRAVAVGEIAKAMQTYRHELWESRKEPVVGVLFDWDNDAMWTALSIKGKESTRYIPMQARVGVSRALINQNIPFEYVIPDDLRAGLAARYRVIYLPGMLALNPELLPILKKYVEDGGRLILDMPGAWMDPNSALLPRGTGSDFANLFGAALREYQFSGLNRNWHLEAHVLTGSIGSIRPEGAEIMADFKTGQPAVTQFQLGKGTSVILGYEAARSCFEPGNSEMEALLLKYTLGDIEPPFTCEGAIVYRLSGPKADHYFLLNQGEATEVDLKPHHYTYTNVQDAVTGQSISQNSIYLEAHSARWLRFEKP